MIFLKGQLVLTTVFCLFLFLPAAIPLQAQSWNFIDDDEASFTVGGLKYAPDDAGTVAECRGFAEGQQAASVSIPATVSHSGHSYRVVSIGEHAFDGTAVSSVTLSEGLRVLRMSAFLKCPLTTVTVPASVTLIEGGVFLTNTMTEARLLSADLELGELVFGGGMQRLYMSAATPPELYNYLAINPDNYQFPLIRVFVPKGSLNAYLANEWWAQHAIIDGDEEQTLTVATTAPGMLRQAIAAQGVPLKGVNHLVVSGPLNSDDIFLIRDSLSNLFTLDMSQTVIRKLPKEAFSGCRFSNIQLPGTLQDMSGSAFTLCPNLEELVIPEGVLCADNLVSNCAKLRSLDLPSTLVSAQRFLSVYNLADDGSTYSCTVTCRAFFPPKAGTYAVFSYGQTDIKVRVPAMSQQAYASATGWKSLALEASALTPATITVVGQQELSTDGLTAGYSPHLSLAQYGNYGSYSASNAFGLLTVKGSKELNVGAFSAYTDMASDRSYSGRFGGELMAEAPITAQSVHLDFDIRENQWYFISFPFDVKISSIKTDADIQHWVIRSYSGQNRAAMRGEQWIDVPYNATLEARRGYIWQVSTGNYDSSRDDLRISVEATPSTIDHLFVHEDVSIALADYASTYEHNAGWNLIGNPYPCYYRIGALKQKVPVTVKTMGYGYEQYRTYSPQDDANRELHPYEAFFVQKPADTDVLVFGAEGRVAFAASNARATVPSSLSAGESSRQLINLVLTANGMADNTRIVLNPAAKAGYERACDAAKFFGSEQVPQLYSFIGSEPCAINERPEADGTVMLGVRTDASTTCTIAMESISPLGERQTGALLVDRMTGTLTDLTATAYTFQSTPGRDDSRFVLYVGAAATTGVQSVAVSQQQTARPAVNLQGQPVGSSYKGIVIENGKLTIKR
jgi:hypothetical protein